MKKFQQLLLIIFSFISLTLFLVYRHEYNRLHYILEVFNFFGTPCNFSEVRKSDKVLNHYDWGQDPVWLDNDNYYTFSGFLNASCAQVIALEVKGSRTPKKCFLWYENNEDPIVGEMSSYAFAKEHDLKAYIYTCRFRPSEDLPYAVSFNLKPNYLFSKKVILTKMENRPLLLKTTVCVPPKKFSKRELIEFISFHELIGIKYFIFYYDDIPNPLTKFLANIGDWLNIHSTFLYWNFPKNSSSLTKHIIEKDCELRTFKKSKATLVLGINEYLIPLDFQHLFSLLEDSSSKYIDVPVQKICITSKHKFEPLALQNKNIVKDNELIVRKFNIEVDENAAGFHYIKYHMVINAYVYCSNDTVSRGSDTSAYRYSTDLIRSTLVQLLIHNQI